MSRTVSLVVLFHVQERVVVKVAVEVDVRSSRRRWSVKLKRDRDQDAERTRHASTTCTLAGADGGRKTRYEAISIYAHTATQNRETHARIEPTHIPVGDAAAIDGSLLDHCVPTGRGLLFVDPVRLEPVLVGYLAELDFAADDVTEPPKTTDVQHILRSRRPAL